MYPIRNDIHSPQLLKNIAKISFFVLVLIDPACKRGVVGWAANTDNADNADNHDNADNAD